ncbi:MAG: hypothetical protein AAB472_02105 [Patescibacteria group bacterium]
MRIRIVVLPAKRLILKHVDSGERVSLPPGELYGLIRYEDGTMWAYFPTASAKLELSEFKKRWDNEVIDAWQHIDENLEEELFT